jgi:hypothetical protein
VGHKQASDDAEVRSGCAGGGACDYFHCGADRGTRTERVSHKRAVMPSVMLPGTAVRAGHLLRPIMQVKAYVLIRTGRYGIALVERGALRLGSGKVRSGDHH